jgi:hypothetical protein
VTAFHHDYTRAPWRKVPLAELTAYRPGYVCKAPAYWAVTEDGCVLFYEARTHSSPQCNRDPAIVKHLHPTLEARLIEQAYVPRGDA